MHRIQLHKSAKKSFEKAPKVVQQKFLAWIRDVEALGLEAANAARPGYQPHPLLGNRQGEMAVRLNQQWRIIYTVDEGVLIVTVLELTPHDYRTR